MSATRGTIFLEQGRVLSQLAGDARQYVLRVAAPR
ncbi:MAG: dihydroorotate dehydrogenase electron transfer subunit, partial [Gammaproteobacteria bacterium]|nr:dihydroorotate dehydrogenase electron transfer subunit [Gammaproteobacteria bacterium]